MINSTIEKLKKYAPVKEQAMYTRIKLAAWTMIILCSVFASITLTEGFEVTIPVQPVFKSTYFDSSILNYAAGDIKLTGDFRISEPSFLQRLLLPAKFWEFDVFNCLFLIILSVIILKVLPYTHSKSILKTDISHWIKYVGWTVMLFWLIDVIRVFFYAMPEIEKLTNHQFMFRKTGYLVFPIQFWLGIGILWVSRLYKNAFLVKQEQELTI